MFSTSDTYKYQNLKIQVQGVTRNDYKENKYFYTVITTDTGKHIPESQFGVIAHPIEQSNFTKFLQYLDNETYKFNKDIEEKVEKILNNFQVTFDKTESLQAKIDRVLVISSSLTEFMKLVKI
ncbi:hypothetical protein F8M41_010484 [Gigaspora margarita]|uniref:Uncharacterized protein n=1 Tax=Gigaspora margarita TaxID=4874 RepID=A0A8H4A189_GIGMA|nr:hypothetical protein F8M41_010484 [Gigaspora margarita]